MVQLGPSGAPTESPMSLLDLYTKDIDANTNSNTTICESVCHQRTPAVSRFVNSGVPFPEHYSMADHLDAASSAFSTHPIATCEPSIITLLSCARLGGHLGRHSSRHSGSCSDPPVRSVLNRAKEWTCHRCVVGTIGIIEGDNTV
jgi:hypothetical protein